MSRGRPPEPAAVDFGALEELDEPDLLARAGGMLNGLGRTGLARRLRVRAVARARTLGAAGTLAWTLRSLVLDEIGCGRFAWAEAWRRCGPDGPSSPPHGSPSTCPGPRRPIPRRPARWPPGAGPCWPTRTRPALLYGEQLRRRRRRVDARGYLHLAADAFDRLGAACWARRARDELRATGETVRRGWVNRDGQGPPGLTPQELQVARAVSQGLTNREAAAQLFISPRTVDHHLRGIYRKLGITSRAELVLLADGLTDARN